MSDPVYTRTGYGKNAGGYWRCDAGHHHRARDLAERCNSLGSNHAG